MDDVIIARALHVLAVVIWIGGVMMATTVILPAIHRGDLGADRLKAFQTTEHRFVWQARTAVIVVGLTGFYTSARLDLWERFRSVEFWWMHAMVCVWLLFTLSCYASSNHSSCTDISAIGLRRRRTWLSLGCIERIGYSSCSARSQSLVPSRAARDGPCSDFCFRSSCRESDAPR
jgi:uncharacterized membrane protein